MKKTQYVKNYNEMYWALHLGQICESFTEEVVYEMKLELWVGVWQVKKRMKKISGVYPCMSKGREVCEDVVYSEGLGVQEQLWLITVVLM